MLLKLAPSGSCWQSCVILSEEPVSSGEGDEDGVANVVSCLKNLSER
jgi:hypothetical protein